MAKILLTDGQQRKTLAAARTLGKQGHEVWVGETTRLSTASFSRYCRGRFVYPHPESHPEEFISALKAFLIKHSCDIVIPMDDITLQIISQKRFELDSDVCVPVPPPEVVAWFRDKSKTMELARRTGVACPQSINLEQGFDPEMIVGMLGLPLVLKPYESSGGRGFCVVGSSEELIGKARELTSRYGGIVAQSYISKGSLFDACLLVDKDSELVAAFVQKELRHYPLKGGTSTLQESVHYPELIESTLKLLKSVGWQGVAEAEYIVPSDGGHPLLLEVNPRFWASVQLAISCGIDFPNLLVDLCTGNEPRVPSHYPAGKRCRWLLPGDILHFIANPDRRKLLPEFFNWKAAPDDIISLNDPGPVLGFGLACLRYLFDKQMWKMLLRR